jgi:hypothetical protein
MGQRVGRYAEDSVLNIWTLPWDNLKLPDITAGCGGGGGGGGGDGGGGGGGDGSGGGDSGGGGGGSSGGGEGYGGHAGEVSAKLRGDGWRRRVRLRKLDSKTLGAANLFWMWWYQATGNTFRLLRAVGLCTLNQVYP